MNATYRIHPAIGIARLGNAPDEFCIASEKPAALPTDCDARGNPLLSSDGTSEMPVRTFKDDQGRIKRQAARFQVYVYDDESPEGRPLKLGDPVSGGGNHGTLVDIQWRVYLANKKASWYEFSQLQGEHGYAPSHPRRNASVTDPEARQRLIIDPGPRAVNATTVRRARFDRNGWNTYAPSFPPPLQPHSIDTLGEILTDDSGRLLVLGGHGNSGTYRYDQFAQPRIEDYANNDGWFDDVSDGPVMARLVMYSEQVERSRFVDVELPAWALVGYPRYVPEMLDMITLDEVLDDLSVRHFATRTGLYGEAGRWDEPSRVDRSDPESLGMWFSGRLQWNPKYRPWFYRDIWPILFRPDQFSYTSNVLGQSNFPHNQSKRGNFDPDKLGAPPTLDTESLRGCEQTLIQQHYSGELFESTLRPILRIQEREARTALAQIPGGAALETALFVPRDTVTKLLREAVAGFTNAVSTMPGADVEYEAYLRAWRELPRGSSPDAAPRPGEAPGSGPAPEHQRAGERLAVAEAKADAVPLDPPAEEESAADTSSAAGRHEPPRSAPTYPKAKQRLERRVLKALNHGIRCARRQVRREGLGGTFTELLDAWARRLREAGTDQIHALHTGRLLEEARLRCVEAATYDPHRDYREFVFSLVGRPGEENRFGAGGKPDSRTRNLPLMPLLAGDNPIDNTLPSKFLRLTELQYYLLRQWARGLFVNEQVEGWSSPDPWNPYAGWTNRTGHDLDRGVLSNGLGGAFCPGGEVGWIIRNPAIYQEPYRIRADPEFSSFRLTAAQANSKSGSVADDEYESYTTTELSQDNDFRTGLQPGDLTKYAALPWQADFNQCSTQDIDITYDAWNEIDPGSSHDTWMEREQKVWQTLWWPAHRPLQSFEITGWKNGEANYAWLPWSRGVPQTSAGDLKMVTEWWRLGFVRKNPWGTPDGDVLPSEVPLPDPPAYISVERSERSGEEET